MSRKFDPNLTLCQITMDFLHLIIIVCDRRSTMGIVKKPFGFWAIDEVPRGIWSTVRKERAHILNDTDALAN